MTEFKPTRINDRPTWQATRGTATVTFYALGRGRRPGYWITFRAIGRSGAQRVESFHAAERRGVEILNELQGKGLVR